MYISYFDETGDDGYPKYSSDRFMLTSLYMHHQNWKENYEEMYKIRKYLKDTYGLPIKLEIHTKHLLTRKKLYTIKIKLRFLQRRNKTIDRRSIT